MIIKRDAYLNKLLSKKHNGLIKVITGIRRCGKSYLLFNLFKERLLKDGTPPERIIEIALDSYEMRNFRDPDVLYPYLMDKIKNGGAHYILLDEVQLLGHFEEVLNSLARKENIDIYVTGSNAKLLSKDIITEFRGRGDEIKLYPLSFAEFMSAYLGERTQGWRDYILYGGLPMIFSFQRPDEKSAFLKTLFEETYISDIIGRNHIRHHAELEELLNILSSEAGSLTNPNKLSATFKSVKHKILSSETIKKYIGYLSDSFLIDGAMRYDIKGKRYIGTPVKYYFTDLGLRNARLNFRQVEETHTMENVIFNELKIRGFNVDIGTVPISGKDKNGKSVRKQLEIDFVSNQGSKRYYIQSAFAIPNETKKRQKERPLLLTGDGFKKIIITKDAPAPLYNEDGILVMSVFDFLLDPDSLYF